jgi:hypothetical protein
MAQKSLEQGVSDGGEGHCRSGMSVPNFLYRIHRKSASNCDCSIIEFTPGGAFEFCHL